MVDGPVSTRKISRRMKRNLVYGLAGVVLLTAGTVDVDPAGILLALIAGTTFPVYGSAAQRLMRSVKPDLAIGSVFVAGSVLLTPLAVGTASEAFATVGSLLTVAYLGIFTLAIAYVLWGFGLGRLTLGVVVVVTLLEPAVASLLGVVVLGEPFTLALLLGVGIVGTGVFLASTTKPVSGTV